MGENKSKILPMVLSVIVLSMLISPTYPNLSNVYAAPAETPTLDVKCQAEANSNKPVTADCQLLNLLNEEVAARIAADIVLQGNIDDEEAARIAADNVLQGNIDDEEAARIAEDNLLKNRVTDLEDMGNEVIDVTIIVLEAAAIIFTAGAIACAANLVPACATAFGALDVLVVTTILILENIEF